MANPKKILIFSLAYHPHVAGAEVAIKEITDRISPQEIEFHLITLRFDKKDLKQEKIGNVLVHRVGAGRNYLSKIFFIPRAAFAARTLHKQYRFDALWAMMSYMVLPIVLMRMLGAKLPYALTIQDGDPFEHVFERPLIRIFSSLLRSGFRHASVVQTISLYLVTWAKRMGYNDRVEVIPNGVDVKKFDGEKISHEGTVLITTSRLVTKNAVDDIINALVYVPQVRLKILGIGPEEAALKTLVRNKDLEHRVEFVGHVEHANLPAYLHAADIFVRPSRSEGMGISFIEAMAAKLPVVATQEGGIADFLFDAKRNPGKPTTGWVVDKDSPKDIARAVEEILGNPEEVYKVIDTAYALVCEQYEWSRIAQEMKEKVFNVVLK